MPKIVAVHGISQELLGEGTLAKDWRPALDDGLHRAGAKTPAADDFALAFYGDLFRPAGKSVVPDQNPADVTDDWTIAMLDLWWAEAARVEPAQVPSPDLSGKARWPTGVQGALNALSGSRFFGGLNDRFLLGALRQVRLYFHDATGAIRTKARACVAACIDDDTRVLIGHSLGSVVAYEVAAADSRNIRTLITLGSPLGIRNLIFDRLDPSPAGDLGRWPGAVERWVNIADQGDVVALEKTLARRFGPRVEDHTVYNGAKSHWIVPYLTAVETGRAVAAGLTD
jgi:hypothetical protein